MPRKSVLRIASVRADRRPLTLHVGWRHGGESDVDVSALVRSFRVYAPLLDDALFEQASVGEHGADVVWTDGLDMSADTLWRLAQEQSGLVTTPYAWI